MAVTIPRELITHSAIAFVPPEGAVDIATIGLVEYPTPPLTISNGLREPDDTIAVAIAPEPLELTIVTDGITVYPIPGFIIIILSIDFPV